jgi:hypothetical protein
VTDKREVRRKLRDLRERRDGPDDLDADDDTPREVKAYRGVDLSAFPGVSEDVLERAEEPGGRVVVGKAAETALENADRVVASDADALAEDREQGASDGDTEPEEVNRASPWRLARCESCSETWPPGLSSILKDSAGRGCPACHPPGYQ